MPKFAGGTLQSESEVAVDNSTRASAALLSCFVIVLRSWRQFSSFTRVLAGITVATGFLYPLSPFRLHIVDGKCMEPTLRQWEFVIVDCEYYRRTTPARGDVVSLIANDESYIKRVAAVGGQTVWLWRDGPNASLDSAPYVTEDRLPQLRRVEKRPTVSGRLVPVRVPFGHVFVVGDNDVSSMDSRRFGPVPIAAITGRVLQF